MKNQALITAIDTYFDAIYFGDVNKLDDVFHSAASLFDSDEGAIFVDSLYSFRTDVENRPSPASVKQVREDEVIMIDFLSPKSATVKLRYRIQDNIFADHLSFIADENYEWRIVAKVWHLESVSKVN